jgi:hypothetical protein
MEIFNYVMVLASIIIGLAITHLLQGVTRLVQHPGKVKLYWVHLVWVAAAFLGAIFWWWWEFRLSTQAWTFQLYVFVLLYAVIIYLRAALLFPDSLEGYDGYEGYLYSRRGWFFGLAIAQTLIDVVDTLLKGWAHFLSLGWPYATGMAAMLLLFGLAIFTENRHFHGALAVAFFVYQIVLALSLFQSVG